MHVEVLARPVELARAIPFPDDQEQAAYDPDGAHRFWTALVRADRVLRRFRSGFVGKASPVYPSWGSFDPTVTRSSGRVAPKHPDGVPNCADWVQPLAYSHELSSCGFWRGGSTEGSFYGNGYPYPTPAGFSEWPVAAPAFCDDGLGELLRSDADVRTAADPDATLPAFLQSTCGEAAALVCRTEPGRLVLVHTAACRAPSAVTGTAAGWCALPSSTPRPGTWWWSRGARPLGGGCPSIRPWPPPSPSTGTPRRPRP